MDRFGPVQASVENVEALVRQGKDHELHVFHGADHNLKIVEGARLERWLKRSAPFADTLYAWLQTKLDLNRQALGGGAPADRSR